MSLTDDRPVRVGQVRVGHVLAGGLAVAATAVVFEWRLAVIAAACGTVALLAGLWNRSQGWVTFGGGLVFGGAVLAGAAGAGVRSILVAAFAGVLAADVGTFAIGIDRDTDPSVATTRVELLHATASGTVAIVTGGLGYALSRSISGGSSEGFVALLFGGVVLVALLRE